MIPHLLTDLLAGIAEQADPERTTPLEPVAPTGNAAHGDYQWNFAFRLAKARKQNPRAVAESLVGQLVHPLIQRAEVMGPGFINLTFDDEVLARLIGEQAATPRLGLPQVGAGKTVVIDYSSPNVAKRMHIGHMRSTHIGNALYRLHLAAGYRTIGDNHIGDWGTQFGKLIVAWRTWRDDAGYAADPIGELERLYVKFGEEVRPLNKDGPADPPDVAAGKQELVAAARAETLKLQKGDPDNMALWQQFMDVSMGEFNAVYARMGVRFDVTMGESAYRDLTDGVVERLKRDGIAEASEGAWIVRFEEPSLKNSPVIVQKRDGASNYTTTDLAAMQYRVEHWRPDRIIIVTDMRQQLVFNQLFSIARRTGVTAELVHAWFGMLVLPEGAMSTRAGNIIRLVDLFDEAVSRARAIVDARELAKPPDAPRLPDVERAVIAEAVGMGAIRYADLSQHPQTDVTFSWDKMLAFEGNTAPYLLYSYARCVTLLARAGETPDPGAIHLGHPLERELALSILRTPEAALAALTNSRPNLLADHCYDLSNRINRVYHDLPVLTGGDARASRLGLLDCARRALGTGLDWLGLTVIDRM
ncbi:MAG: arginine--tRNA ligase [Myxococcales bacterium]|nr:arginine--tRNA ligase [Myxococcales bacterium]